jgi:hypothetical protein
MDSYIKANLDWWNEVVGVHAQGDTYGLERFKGGMSRLKYLEREEVGEVAGKSLLHRLNKQGSGASAPWSPSPCCSTVVAML